MNRAEGFLNGRTSDCIVSVLAQDSGAQHQVFLVIIEEEDADGGSRATVFIFRVRSGRELDFVF